MVSGGSGSISEPLAKAIAENAGEIRTGTQVDKVVIENGRVRGVNGDCQDRVIPTQVLDTEFIEAPVVAAAVPLWQILDVVSEHDLPPWYVERIRCLEKKALFTWTMTYLMDAKPPFEESERMCVPKGASSGRPWIAAVLPYAEVEGQYAVTCFFYTGWYEPPSVFEAARAGVRAEIREKFGLFEAEIQGIYGSAQVALQCAERILQT
jgi:protoporphyrinogen oxidase